MAEQLWAPWRSDYVSQVDKAPKSSECLFEALPAMGDDREALILHRGETAYVLLNRYPYCSGHLMVAPFRHCSRLSQLNDQELLEINQLVSRAVEWLEEAYSPDGFNVGVNLGRAAGAGIPGHLHWHIVPRWSGDTNFMTAVGGVRVIPQSLEGAYDKLKEISSRS